MRKALNELMRPTDFDDLMQPARLVASLKRMARQQQPVNMLFYGEPSVGKTTAARILLKQLGTNSVTLNGSLDNGVDVVRKLETVTSSLGLGEGPQVLFIDEADYLSMPAQAGLRALIEQRQHWRFLLAANDISKMHPALKSRCPPVCFDISVSDGEDVIARLLPRYRAKLKAEDIEVDEARLTQLLHTYFPDLRAFTTVLEMELEVYGMAAAP